ncbi:uncharacterized protein LOC142336467 isoform X2 [Convolutriloba macropyga]|uniref:uncharacterized protein LOC142336467 isoform X2 n=1 Tax=Convolutriloba macropyga TaxID=536237 RepID=UPI003F51E8EB
MRIQKFVIVFDRANSVYRQGDTISGKVVLSLEKALKLKALRVQIVGETLVRWEYGVKKVPKKNSNHTFSAREEYFNYKRTLHGRADDDKKSKTIELGRGDYEFPFNYTLPSDISLPTSLEGPYGYVRYFARAVIERPFSKNCYTIKPFTILGVLDLNLDESSLVPSNNSKVHGTTSCFCCRSSNTVINLALSRTGYCPGEHIKISATVENNTSNKILRSAADLLQIVDYTGSQKQIIGSQTKTRRTMKTIQSVRGEGCASHSNLIWDANPMVVPAIPPSKLAGCAFIDIRYILRFTIFFKDNKRVFTETPVLIGTEPLRLTYPMYHEGMDPIGAPPIRLSVEPAEPSAPPCETPPYDCPPPSYEACVYGGATLTEDEFTMGQTTFVPMYQVYNTLRSQTRSTGMSNRGSTVEPTTLSVGSVVDTPNSTSVGHHHHNHHQQSPVVREQSLNSTVAEVSYSESRFNPNDERYIYSTPNPHARTESGVNHGQSTPSPVTPVTPLSGGRTSFRPSSSSPPHSPQHEEDDTEASASVHHANDIVFVEGGMGGGGHRRDSSDNESSGLPEDAMIPLSELDYLSDDEREHPPPAPLHTGKYQNDFVAVENEIYMAYGQDQHHESSNEAPNTPGSQRGLVLDSMKKASYHDERMSRNSKSPVSPTNPNNNYPPDLLPRSTSQSSSGGNLNMHTHTHHHQQHRNHGDNIQSTTTTTTTHYYSVKSSEFQPKVMGPTGDDAIMLVDAEGSLGSDFNSDQELYMDEARA